MNSKLKVSVLVSLCTFTYSCSNGSIVNTNLDPGNYNKSTFNPTNDVKKPDTVQTSALPSHQPVTSSPQPVVASPTSIPVPVESIQPIPTSLPSSHLIVPTPIPSVSTSTNNSSSGYSSYTPSAGFVSGSNNSSSAQIVQPQFTTEGLNDSEALGKTIFFDIELSQPRGQSCSSCHDPNNAFATPQNKMTGGVTPGIQSLFGNRNTPSAMYMATDPDFAIVDNDGDSDYSGGAFWDGRAKNIEEQALGPFLNKAEMNMPDKQAVINKIKSSNYADKFKKVFGDNVFDNTEDAYKKIGVAIGSYERSKELNPFTSKYDYYKKGVINLTPAESRGMDLFKNKANCAACHPLETDNGEAGIFTDFSYDNLGLPKNTENPFYTMPNFINPSGSSFIDYGLAQNPNVNNTDHNGRFKVPTLRNVQRTAPYMHNGVFKTLKDVIRFYNSSCAQGNPDNWAPPEVPEGRNCSEIGDLKLTSSEMDDLETFLNTLTDGYNP